MVQRFPTPRLQTDDGNQEIAEMHAREDLLLDYYSWVDRSSGKVRIPIARAMQLIAQHGLPGSSRGADRTLMAGDKAPGGDRAAHRWIRPDRLRAAIPGNRGAAADAGRKAGRPGSSRGQPLSLWVWGAAANERVPHP
jgi:hypothetical protein